MALLETQFYSTTLDLTLGMNVILPEHPEAWSEPPAVLYLLHGLSDNQTAWVRQTAIERYASEYNLAIIMPDAYKSFYCNMEHGANYGDFFTDELPQRIKQWFNISTDWKKTFVAGLSMGGFGAMKLALSCPGKFAAAASLSGALDLASRVDDDWGEGRAKTFASTFGDLKTIQNSENDLIARLQSLEEIPDTDFYICCGTEDFCYPDYISFRDQATQAGLRLTHEEAEGDHNWEFWDAYIQRVLEWLPIEKLAPSE